MVEMEFPNPFEFEAIEDFFLEVRKVNSARPEFSMRKLSRDLGWPIGLIPDLVAGRKGLSLLRVLEFATYAGYSSLETERMVAIACFQGAPTLYRDKLLAPSSPEIPVGLSLPIADENFFLCLATFEVIRWKNGLLDASAIHGYLGVERYPSDQIASTIEFLVSEKVVQETDEGKFETLVDKIEDFFPYNGRSSEDNAKLHKSFIERFLSFCDSACVPNVYMSQVVPLDPKHLPEFFQRMYSLYNWWAVNHWNQIWKVQKSFRLQWDYFPSPRQGNSSR